MSFLLTKIYISVISRIAIIIIWNINKHETFLNIISKITYIIWKLYEHKYVKIRVWYTLKLTIFLKITLKKRNTSVGVFILCKVDWKIFKEEENFLFFKYACKEKKSSFIPTRTVGQKKYLL